MTPLEAYLDSRFGPTSDLMEIEMTKLTNAGTSEAQGDLHCDACHHEADINTYAASMSVYSDVCCPKCGSTNNEHNRAYSEILRRNMAAVSRGDQPTT